MTDHHCKCDPRPVHVKVVGGRFVTVLPPSNQVHDDVAWREPKAGAHHTLMRQVAALDGRITTLNEMDDDGSV